MSYADPRLIEANLDFIHDPMTVECRYATEFKEKIGLWAITWSGLVASSVANWWRSWPR